MGGRRDSKTRPASNARLPRGIGMNSLLRSHICFALLLRPDFHCAGDRARRICDRSWGRQAGTAPHPPGEAQFGFDRRPRRRSRREDLFHRLAVWSRRRHDPPLRSQDEQDDRLHRQFRQVERPGFRPGRNLLSCDGADGGGRCVRRWNLKTGKSETLADRYQGKRFNSPNDLCLDAKGRVYFTDPRYGGTEPRELQRSGLSHRARWNGHRDHARSGKAQRRLPQPGPADTVCGRS